MSNCSWSNIRTLTVSKITEACFILKPTEESFNFTDNNRRNQSLDHRFQGMHGHYMFKNQKELHNTWMYRIIVGMEKKGCSRNKIHIETSLASFLGPCVKGHLQLLGILRHRICMYGSSTGPFSSSLLPFLWSSGQARTIRKQSSNGIPPPFLVMEVTGLTYSSQKPPLDQVMYMWNLSTLIPISRFRIFRMKKL